MKPKENDIITIVGGGLSGPVMAMYLAKHGFKVHVYERRPDIREQKLSAGRSINLALSKRGIFALQDIGVFEKIKPLLIPMYGRQIHDLDGTTRLLPYGNAGQFINSVSRSELNKILITESEQTGNIRFFFQHVCTGLEKDTHTLNFHDIQTDTKLNVNHSPVIAADGSGSIIRRFFHQTGDLLDEMKPLEHSYKELNIPPDNFGQYQLDPNALHIWPRGRYMLIALPNMDRSFTVTLFLPNKGDISFASILSDDQIESLFIDKFPDVKKLIPNLCNNFFTNPTGKLGTVQCFPWNVKQTLLIGDAAHAVVPFFGQGMNASFEDCTILSQMMDSHIDWEKLFESFSNYRKKDGDAIADMALENYIEMRDLVNKRNFLSQRELEIELEKKYPNQFISRYSMVSFHQIPYSVIKERGKFQQNLMTEIMERKSSKLPMSHIEVENKINSNLSKLN